MDIKYFTVCNSCMECYWYEKEGECSCKGAESICNEFLFNEEI